MRLFMAMAFCALLAAPAMALDVGSDGSDGPLNVTSTNLVIDLSRAATASWDTPAPVAGDGVYDSLQWAVVFKYSSVNIASGRTVTFINHPADAPVVWLVQGDVTIAGTVSLNGQNYTTGTPEFRLPGPGGFRGGRGYESAQSLGSAGFGPGGGLYNPGNHQGGGGSYGSAGAGTSGPTYGNERALPLIGGSGGAGCGTATFNGGGGGGAIIIASNQTINIATGGLVSCLGGAGRYDNPYYSGGGSGGAIRLIGNAVTGNASGLQANGQVGGNRGGSGYIRIEANSIVLSGASDPNYTLLQPLDNDEAVIWPPSTAPSVKVLTIAGVAVPDDPHAEFNPPGDVGLVTTEPVEVELSTLNVPRDWNVVVRVTLRSGDEYYATAARPFPGDSTYWTAELQALPSSEFVAIQARAYKP